MQVEIYTVVKNGEAYIPLYLEHYKKSFPGCIINIYDNASTDATRKLCEEAGCILHSFPKYTERLLQNNKNTCWQLSQADWVIVCDIDEIALITQEDIEALPPEVNLISFEGYQMFDPDGKDIPLQDLTYGAPDTRYDKFAMFKPAHRRVVYDIGAHNAIIRGCKSQKKFKFLHYNKGYLQQPYKKHLLPYLRRNRTKILGD